MTDHYNHSNVAEEVAGVVEEIDGLEVLDVSRSSNMKQQFLVLSCPPIASELSQIMDETGCAITFFKRWSLSDHEDAVKVWFGHVSVGIGGPQFVDR